MNEPTSRRAFLKLFGLSTLAVILQACSPPPSSPTTTSAATPTIPPTLSPTPMPANGTARAFIDAWGKGDYASMYGMLSSSAQTAISQDDFVKRYQSIAAEATVTTNQPQLVSVNEDGSTATVQFKTHLNTALFGPIDEDNAFSMVREGNRWGIVWSPAVILKDLGANNSLRLLTQKSTRGNIYDRNGQPIAIGQQAILVSLWPAEMRRNQAEAKVLAALAPVLNLSQYEIQRRYGNANPEWKVAIATISKDTAQANADALSLPGIVLEQQDARAYSAGAVAAHIVGYVGQITGDELGQFYAQGYREGDMLGRTGLEKAGDKYLTGVRGGRLIIVGAKGEELGTLKEQEAQQSSSIYSTIDLNLQTAVDTILGQRRGSIIVMNVKTGEVLAMVSHPAYDPNAFVDNTRQKERQNVLTSPAKLLLNRASQGAYPQGSVEKIITIAAAFERGGLGQYTPFVCNGTWNGTGIPKACWIAAYGRTHGAIGLAHALTASCDITFYQVGVRLDKINQRLMSTFALAFGLGSATGIEIEENAGHVPDPQDQQPWILNDAADTAIGQDTFLTSPLQIVDFVAAVANGGTLWKPRLISKVQDLANGTEQQMPSEKRGTLPVSGGNLQIIRDALKGVTTDKDGTAKFVFDGLPIICAGKTGTAQVPGAAAPHAWFAGYAPADAPQIACVVMVENGGEGSQASAPLFRKVIEKYFNVKAVTPTPGKGKPTPTPVIQPGD
ncbi:MAG: penicillin-binding protein 2 [Anaerolineae bacterium]